uniref:Uncharacterized protein n=1 Tax=Setaria italica TaxID=4555 RepID=K4A3J2_SETIT
MGVDVASHRPREEEHVRRHPDRARPLPVGFLGPTTMGRVPASGLSTAACSGCSGREGAPPGMTTTGGSWLGCRWRRVPAAAEQTASPRCRRRRPLLAPCCRAHHVPPSPPPTQRPPDTPAAQAHDAGAHR